MRHVGIVTIALTVVFPRHGLGDESPNRSPELQVLDQFVGAWDEEMTNKPTEWTPQEKKSASITTCKWALGGKFVRAEGKWQPANTECLHLMTYDPYAKTYRSWYFDAADNMPRAVTRGEWDEKTRTMTWRDFDEAGNKSVSTHRFLDNDHAEWTVVVKNPAGKVVLDLAGASARRKD